MTKIWDPVRIGEMNLPQRLAMAPMTRDRSTPEGVPSELNALYYAQRASTGLLITEGTQPSEDGQGYLLTPGIHSAAQVAGWRKVTDAVHAAGGKLFIQLMHVGRISHPDKHAAPPPAGRALGGEAGGLDVHVRAAPRSTLSRARYRPTRSPPP
jgi:N-ethylmaleimide reductase